MNDTYLEITRSGGKHDDMIMDLFNSLLSFKNETFNAYIQRTKDNWEVGTYYVVDEIITSTVEIYNITSEQNIRDSPNYYSSKVVALIMSPVKIISVTILARQFNNQEGTWIKTCWYHSTFSWDHENNTIDFSHPSYKLLMLQVNPGYSELVSFCSLFEAENDRYQPYPLMVCQTLLPTDKLADIYFVINDIYPEALESITRFSLYSSISNIHSIGDKLRLSRNGVNQIVDIIAVDVDKKHQIPYFIVVL